METVLPWLVNLFTPATLLAEGQGWPLFGAVHVAWLAASCALIAFCVLHYRALPRGKARRRMSYAVTAVPLALLASQDIGFIATDTFAPSWWPLHSCNACELLGILYAAWPAPWIGRRSSAFLPQEPSVPCCSLAGHGVRLCHGRSSAALPSIP